MTIFPTFQLERELLAEGYTIIAGADEAGCGAWAGPVYAAAVILPLHSRLRLIRDSKLLTRRQREGLFEKIIEKADWGVGTASAGEIDSINIRQAAFLATRRALGQLHERAQVLLSDGFEIPEIDIPCRAVIKGDQKVKSIAAASIIAKVLRDKHMREMHEAYPQYGFNTHAGYGTKKHQSTLKKYGVCAIHRKSYAPIKNLKPG